MLFSHFLHRLTVIEHNTTPTGTYFDGTTTFVNASTCTRSYRATNLPIVIDLPLDPTLPAQVVDYDAQTFEEADANSDSALGR